MPKRYSRIRWTEVAVLLAIVLVAALLWDTALLFPLRSLVVFFHEISHGIAALVTGGSIVEIQIAPGRGGLCITRGGWPFVILSAGYVGSMLCGGTLLVLSARWNRSQYTLGIVAVVLIAVTLLWVRPILAGGFLFGLVAGVALLACAVWASQHVNALTLKTIGLTSCLYVLVDLFGLLRGGTGQVSDATLLAEATWLPAWFWAAFWLAISGAVAWRLLMFACHAQDSRQV
ncbi:MAG: M50 family metallopeptidase [Candidatus Hydrogenedentes bacterium]|nr:M50 family metallopeptidase [Candidatus Hydrogenedentota bacterium]